MSSIDKYVIEEARRCNSQAKVTRNGEMLEGRINGKLVFSIRDRYGYLNDSERSTIQNSISDYEEEERERRRREEEERRRQEAIRIENERKAARADFKRSIQETRSRLQDSYNNAKRLSASVASSVNVATVLNQYRGYNISAFLQRAQDIEVKIKSCADKIESDYNSRRQEIDKLEQSVGDSASKAIYVMKQESVKQISVNLNGVTFPISDIGKLNGEARQLAEVMEKIKKIEADLQRIDKGGLAGSVASQCLKDIKQCKLSSLDDVNKLLETVQSRCLEIRSLKFQEQGRERNDQIALLNGILSSCNQAREYRVSQTYEAWSHREDIVRAANEALKIYSGLDTAAYTTCSKDRIKEVYECVQRALTESASDEHTLEHLRNLIGEGHTYQTADRLQESNYAEYLKKVNEMIARGVPSEEIEQFDASNYGMQRKRLNQKLIDLDVEERTNNARVSFIRAWKVMEDMGFRMLYQAIDEEGDEGLACEGVFVKPGCDGVVWQVVVSDDNISRRIIGIRRNNGTETSIQRVKEVAKKAEDSGDVNEFFEKYAQESGTMLEVAKDVYTDSPDCEQTIATNGSFVFESDEAEESFDKLVATGDEREKKKWSTNMARQNTCFAVDPQTAENKNGQHRSNEAAKTKAKIIRGRD